MPQRNLFCSKDYGLLLAQLERGLMQIDNKKLHYICQICLLCAGTGKRISDVCNFTKIQILMLLDLGRFSFRVKKTGSLGTVVWYGESYLLKKIIDNWIDFKCSRASLYRYMDAFLQTYCHVLPKKRGIKFHEFRFKLAGRLYDELKTHREIKHLLDHNSNRVTNHYIAQELFNIFQEREAAASATVTLPINADLSSSR